MIGKSLAHYKVVEKIGAGGMGEVYRASDSKLGRDVALKFLPPVFAKNAERMARFKREAQVLASLNHPNIGTIYGLEDEDNVPALVLELIDGPTLHDRIRSGRLSVEEVLPIARQIAEAVEAAHEKGIIHRDLKPANVKLTPGGKVKVLDFGLAKALEGDVTDSSETHLAQSPTITGHMTGANVILGTAAYMSPEQARGHAVDKRSDIWAFGVIVFEMLTGRQLFTGETVSDTLAGVLRMDVDWDSLPAETPPRLRRVLRRCLERDPKKRLRDIGDARLALEEELAGVPDETPSMVSAAAPVVRRSPWMLAGVAAAAALIAAAAVWMLRPGRTPEIPLRKFAFPLRQDDPSLTFRFEPALSPDGKSLAYLSQGRLWILDFAHLEPREVPGTEGARSPFWSPDGAWIGFGGRASIRKVPRDGGEPVLVAALPAGHDFNTATGACWTTDGRIVYSPGSAGLFIVSAQGGDPADFLEMADGELDFHDVTALPGGRSFVFVVHKKEGGYDTLSLLRPDGARETLLTLEGQSLEDPRFSPTGHIFFHRTPNASGVWALPFSLKRLEVTGEPFLVAADATLPTAAGDGTLAFVRGATVSRSQLVWVDRSGEITGEIGDPDAFLPWPSLSPDDGRIVVRTGEDQNRDLWVYDVNRGSRSRLTFSREREDVAFWHPNGDWIFYYTVDDEMIRSKRADGTGEDRIHVRGILPFVTPDGARIVYSSPKEGASTFDISTIPLEEENPEPVVLVTTSTTAWWSPPSPDGKYILYVSDESGRSEIFATTFPEPRGRWQVSAGEGYWPRWRADGSEIFYTNWDSIMVVDVDTSSGFRAGRPRLLFQRPKSGRSLPWPDGFDVTSEGEQFVMCHEIREETAETPSIVVVQNWIAEFEK